MLYFNYHAKAKRLINEGKLINWEIVDKWNSIAPALVLYFKNEKPMPIREYKWNDYFKLLYDSKVVIR